MARPEKHIRIALMGATGSGKSAFINLASGSGMVVGHSLRSCTSEVQTSEAFFLDGCAVTLIDTPGFDDTTRSDTDILSCIAAYLSSTYKQGYKLAGIIYMHRISDPRMGGTSMRNFRMFRNLCGDDALRNVAIVTNMWGNVDLKIGEEREHELATNDKFFKPVLERDARLLRHDGTQASTLAILRRLINNEEQTLLIQDEIVNQHKRLIDTAAGAELDRDLREQAERHKEELEKLREEMEDAARAQDEETRLELQEELDRERERLERIKRDSERLVADFMVEKSRLASKLAQVGLESRHHGVQVSEEVEIGSQSEHARSKVEGLNGPEEERKARKFDGAQHDLHYLRDQKKKSPGDARPIDFLDNAREKRNQVLASALPVEAAQPQSDVRGKEGIREEECSRTPRGSASEQNLKGTMAQELPSRYERNAEPGHRRVLVKRRPMKRRTHSYAVEEHLEDGYEIIPSALKYFQRRISLCDEDKFPFHEAGEPPSYGSFGYEYPIFLGSAIFGERTRQPCKINPNLPTRCCVPRGDYETVHKGRYDLLPLDPEKMEWVSTRRGRIPPRRTPVDGGHEENGEKLYHALASVRGLRIPGRTGKHLGGCNFSYDGKGYTATEHDILCWK